MSNIDTKTSKGLLGKKLGMTQVWDENNKLIPVTVIEITPNVVTQVRTPEVDGYNAVQIAYGQIDPRKVNKPAAGHFDKAGVTPRRHLTEVRTADAAEYSAGQELTVDAPLPGRPPGARPVRPQCDGVSAAPEAPPPPRPTVAHRRHRKAGSIGASAGPSGVFKGKRMACRMGGERVTVLNLKVQAVDAEKGLLLVKGAVPGARGRIVFVRNAVKGA